ncbi:amino acid transporter [Zalerion maritima]|uniref:Amino acid transporter n=1 Tax=Zalerion maritima TaxID=339359 RepID=A0AAD5WNG4_9PEZI|nr:amino acid transporter [Zalerion maritima]
MPDNSSISYGSFAGESNNVDMARTRRSRSGKDGGGGGQASPISSIINLLNTIIGAGTLAMPSVMSHMGITLGVFMILWSGLTSSFGLYLQARCARYLDRGTSSFFALSQLTYPNAAIVFDTAIAVKCFGVGVSYMIIIGDLMPGVMKGLLGDDTVETIPFLLDRNFWVTAFMLVIIPLAFLRRLDSLKYTSVIALVSIGYLIILVVYHFAADTIQERGEVNVIEWQGPVAMLSTLPIVIFAYTCHQNMFSILNEIKDNSPASIVGVIGGSIGSAASVYILVAITGYLTFGNDVVGNIIQMYHSSVASTIGKAAIVVLVTFSIPLQIHPCRASLDAVLKWRPKGSRNGHGSRADSPSGGGRPLLPSNTSAASVDSHGSPVSHISDVRFAILTTLIIVASYMTSLSVSSLDRVLAYVGSTGSTSISFILPGLFFYKISDPEDIHHQRLTKEDDDADAMSADDDNGGAGDDSVAGSAMLASITSLQSGMSGAGGSGSGGVRNFFTRWRRRFRWDLEHLEHGFLRKMALALAIYGMVVMAETADHVYGSRWAGLDTNVEKEELGQVPTRVSGGPLAAGRQASNTLYWAFRRSQDQVNSFGRSFKFCWYFDVVDGLHQDASDGTAVNQHLSPPSSCRFTPQYRSGVKNRKTNEPWEPRGHNTALAAQEALLSSFHSADRMDSKLEATLDETTLSTISLLEARLLRIEHLLYGPTKVKKSGGESTTAVLADLEHRFATLLRNVRIYADLLKIYRSQPALFHPDPISPAVSLDAPELRATVLASSSLFAATSSSLTAVFDAPVPDPRLSADLAALAPRMKGIEAIQMAQAADIAALRSRSEAVIRKWYEQGIVGNSEFISNTERKVVKVEQFVRRKEREAEEDD